MALLRLGNANLEGFLEEIGLRRRTGITCVYSEETPGISASVHGDDVTVQPSREDAEWLTQRFKGNLRNHDADDRRSHRSEEAAPDPQQKGKFPWAFDRRRVKALGLEGASPSPTPGVAATGETKVEHNEGNIDPEWEHEEMTMFRAVAAMLNHLETDPTSRSPP